MARDFYWEQNWPQIIAEQESTLLYEEFTRDMALELGMIIRELAQEKYKGGAAIRIIEDGMVIFAFKMPGSCEENDWWMNKKLAVSRMTETSSLRAYVESRAGLREAEWEAREDNFAACGGCFPVFRKDGKKPIHHVMVSGLHHHEDHQIIADAMSRQLGIEVPSIIR